MTTSEIQIKANQTNAQKSTGPVTEEGKQIVANNALKHGLFSKHLVLSDENPENYQLLFDGLQTELKPVGTLEQSLVERIAVTLWRQRRLIRSETAHIELSNKPSIIAAAVNIEMGLLHSDDEITEDDLIDFDQEHLQWCQSILQEIRQIAGDKLTDMDTLKKEAPLIYDNLAILAEDEGYSIEEYIKSLDEPLAYFHDLIKYCLDEIQIAKQRPLVLEIARAVRNKRAILEESLLNVLAKYQVMLDNELYKAIKALRETQAWRLDALQSVSGENGFVLEKGKDSEN
ncbi:MAG: hypothetical protein PHF31_05825 [Methylobacter sp.]|nr:hypothetical protein [Methylobacter sp.]